MDINQLILLIFSNYIFYRLGMYVGAMNLLTKLEEEARQEMEKIIEQLKLQAPPVDGEGKNE